MFKQKGKGKILPILAGSVAGAVLLLGGYTMARGDQLSPSGRNSIREGEGRKPYQLPPNLQDHFQNRYPGVDDFLISTLQETPDGPLGQINIRGEIAPAAGIPAGTAEERVRATARAFLREEAALLDIADPAELREVSLKIGEEGEAAIAFVRDIGGIQLLDTFIQINTDPAGSITRVHATLKPVSAELYEAVGRKTLHEDRIIRIVQRDLAPPADKDLVKFTSVPGKLATWRAPFVVWTAAASVGGRPAWSYTIDAFTGEILGRSCTATTLGRPGISTPCDGRGKETSK